MNLVFHDNFHEYERQSFWSLAFGKLYSKSNEFLLARLIIEIDGDCVTSRSHRVSYCISKSQVTDNILMLKQQGSQTH